MNEGQLLLLWPGEVRRKREGDFGQIGPAPFAGTNNSDQSIKEISSTSYWLKPVDALCQDLFTTDDLKKLLTFRAQILKTGWVWVGVVYYSPVLKNRANILYLFVLKEVLYLLAVCCIVFKLTNMPTNATVAHNNIPTLLYSPWEKIFYSKSFKSQKSLI